jgi:hypothetical protein
MKPGSDAHSDSTFTDHRFRARIAERDPAPLATPIMT